jgi:hypothetical protein
MGKRHAPNHAKSHLPVRANGLLARIDRGGVVGAIRFTDFTQAVLSDHVDAVVRHGTSRLAEAIMGIIGFAGIE